MADVFTIDDLNALTTLTAADEVPVWDSEESGEPTKKITASNLAASVKSLASLPNTTEMNNAIQQSTASVAAGIAIHGNRLTASFSSLLSCTGNVVAVPEIILSGGYALMQGRVTINNYVRTGANPTVFVTIPNGKKVKNTFISIANGYTANESNVRLGELLNVQGNAGESVIRIFASETYSNFTGSRAFFVLSPFVFEIT